MKITLIYDNEVCKEGLEASWGFSSLIEVEGAPRILFDTGGDGGVLLRNMEKLGIAPGSIDEVFISHPHWDHTGGLADFLKANGAVKCYVPASFSGVSGAREVIIVREPVQIHENIFSTGELGSTDQYILTEQSLLVKTEKGIVVIVGCSHPGVGRILEEASRLGKVHALIGGLHGFRDFGLLESLGLICPTHCTQFKEEIKDLYPEKCIDGGAGRVILL